MSIKNHILLDVPVPIMTPRLVLRPIMPGDGKEIFDAIAETRDNIKKWLPWVEGVKSWEDSEKTAREFYAAFILRNKFDFGIYKNDQFIGGCGINGPNWSIPSAHIGYWCRISEQGKGYIREATAALTLYAFKQIGFKRVTILCDDENVKSAAIPEALGYILEIKAKGLLAKPGKETLSFSRRYVRFDVEGLESWKITW